MMTKKTKKKTGATKKKAIDKPLVGVWKRNYLNRSLIQAELNDGRVVTVKVRDSQLYCDGMAFEVKEDGDNFYEQKVPRQRVKV